jgi:hypothetical protein
MNSVHHEAKAIEWNNTQQMEAAAGARVSEEPHA